MKKEFIALASSFFIAFATNLHAQQSMPGDTIQFTKAEAETLFLQQNISLISEKLNIDEAQALVIQARLWPNPTVTLEEVNFWNTAEIDQSGYYGSVQLEQTLPTGGKRKHAIAMQATLASVAEMSFEDALRELKLDFRNQLIQLNYLQQYSAVFSSQLQSISTLISAFENQLQQGNISRAEVLRLKALELEVLNEINEIAIEKNQVQQALKLLMNLPANVVLQVNTQDFIPNTLGIKSLNLESVIEAAASRPDLRVKTLENDFYKSQLAYEKAQRIPDVDVSVFYDFGKNPMFDFVGVGLSFDLPVFNRNRGNIAASEIALENAELLSDYMQTQISQEVATAYQNLINHLLFYEKIDPDYEEALDALLDSYTNNFRQRNISLLEYLDFVETYIDNKNILLSATKNILESIEKLNYTAGRDLIDY